MAFELIVACCDRVPVDLRERWPASLTKHDIQGEIHPGFTTPDDWGGGFLPFRIDAIPHNLIDAAPLAPAITGFEVDFHETSAHFRSAMGRTCSEFALLCLCAAELAMMTSGEIHDPQTGESYAAGDARQAALNEIRDTLAYPGAADRKQYPFESWS